MKSSRIVPIIVAVLIIPCISYASFQQAYELYRKGKYYDAEKILLKEKELSPNNLDVLAVLGWCYYYTRRYSTAIEICEEGLKINPKDTRFLTTIGRSYYEFKQYKDAIAYFEKSIAYYYLGRVYLEQGKYILAEAAFSASIALDDNRDIFYRYRGEVYERMADYRASESDYKKALSLKPNDPKLKEALIRVISRQTELEAEFSSQ
jgi:tetratricopeptide (TPR) repeat protein